MYKYTNNNNTDKICTQSLIYEYCLERQPLGIFRDGGIYYEIYGKLITLILSELSVNYAFYKL